MAPPTATRSARIEIAAANARPGVSIREKTVIFHLTQGFDGSGIAGPAFEAKGVIPADPSFGAAGSDLGFVQVMRTDFFGAFYAGRIRGEGSVAVVAHVPPALPKAVLLDSDDAFSPWTRKAPRFVKAGATISASTSDHPASLVPRTVRNSLRNVNNFLFHFVDRRTFWSALTARDPAGIRTVLSHFLWELHHDVTFTWRGGQPAVSTSRSTFKILQGDVKGVPADPEVAGLLTTPVGPQANTAAAAALQLAFKGPRGPNRSENEGWFFNVPADFYT